MKSKVEEINHTADLAIRVSSDTWLGLVSACFHATHKILAVPNPVGQTRQYAFECRGADRLGTLISFLNEMLYHFEKGYVPVEFQVKLLEEDMIQGEMVVNSIQKVLHRIKAVTFHGGDIQENQNSLSVTLVYDI